MSYEIGMKALRLEFAERVAHTEYCSNYALVRAVTGLDPLHDEEAWRSFYDAWEYDFIWLTNDGPVGWEMRGRVTDMGHAEFLEGGIDKRTTISCPFKDVDEVLSFDAVKEYGLPDFDELVSYYEGWHRSVQARYPNQVCPGGYYKTLISGAIQAFGWEMLLTAAAERKRFAKVLDSFFELSLHHYRAWAKTSINVFICHDDMVWTQGPFMHPDFYRDFIFPKYKKLWDVLHEAGKLVLFCSDGDWSQFVDDIANSGADGFIFEPLVPLEYVVERYGKSHIIIGSKVDCRTLTFGTKEQIKSEIEETLKLAKGCMGFFFAVGNHIPSNVPVDNALFYFDFLRAHWWR
ncbi:MAG: hypothetical protein RUDDFDWM_001374 [Candidatus Fervidibacterota bacterium]